MGKRGETGKRGGEGEIRRESAKAYSGGVKGVIPPLSKLSIDLMKMYFSMKGFKFRIMNTSVI